MAEEGFGGDGHRGGDCRFEIALTELGKRKTGGVEGAITLHLGPEKGQAAVCARLCSLELAKAEMRGKGECFQLRTISNCGHPRWSGKDRVGTFKRFLSAT